MATYHATINDPIETDLALWRNRLFLHYKRKEISCKELSSLFQQKELNSAFFKIMDHDFNGSLSLEEWTGCFSKLLGDNDPSLVNWFVDKYKNYCELNDKVFITEDDFALIVMDIEFGYRFCAIIDSKSRRVSTIQLITALEMIASLSVDTKWLSWLKYQFQEAMKQNNRLTPGECRLTFNDFLNSFIK